MTSNDERQIRTSGAEVPVEVFGEAGDPTVLLIAGAATSMLGWPEQLCEQIAGYDLRVVRYDQRDSGRATTFPRGEPGYTVDDLADDAAEVLEAVGARSAHVVGHSMGSAVATALYARRPDLIASLTLMSSTTGADDLPMGSGASPEPPEDLDSVEALTEFLMADYRACDGGSAHFDPEETRRGVDAELERATDMGTTVANHLTVLSTMGGEDLLGSVAVPTLVVHGDRDGIFPPEHGRAVAAAVAGARLVVLSEGGHDLLPVNHEQFVSALVDHVRAAGQR